MIRSPIIVCVGHIDHGKTTLLDCIRGTTVTKLEPGMITQHAGASYVPIETVQKICGDLLQKLKVKLFVPGLLFLDTPGHAAFITLRKRGGAVSDLAILVVDVMEGFQEQTDESLKVLREFKTPFVVAATKIDKIPGWVPFKNSCFFESFQKQSETVKNELERRIYTIIAQLSERGFNSERFDRVEDFRKQVAIVPCSGITGEGIPELLVVLAGLAQHFLKDRLELSSIAKGVVLEVKETVGFGITIDVILYDGKVKKGDFLVAGGKELLVTKIRALLRPKPLRELRVEKQFENVEEVSAAAGIKIAAPDLEKVIAGSPIRFVSSEEEIEKAKAEVQKEVEEVEFLKEVEGVVVKADTLGSLEAMIKILTDENIPIRKAEVGHVTKQDIIEAQNVSDEFRKVVLAFNVKILEEARNLAKDLKIEIFQNNIIYRLVEDYKQWAEKKKELKIKEKMERLVWPGKIKILPGYVFRVSKPAIFGIEVLSGRIRPKVLLINKEGKEIGEIKEIQREMQTISEAKVGDRVAISMEEPTVGRQIHEGEVLYVKVPETDLKEILKEFKSELTESELKIIEEMKEILYNKGGV
ncbi:MAG: translation initiation factor IF-2 [Candidatus Aenigmatarchaeota archaeon]